ncbi:DUF4240 domain-containing protein [Streptomyces vilmorinianum]|uniref:DUF4240 domain-containing protein n=1 Tax=Streptomyces vilmorinianum TaxID=3051092 RepID=UPI0010FB08FC|nr:DUF4240 domain-containing protein [Streptomyces vilmorinianum]
MDENAFWALIEDLRRQPGDRDDRLEWLSAELLRRPAGDSVAFHVCLERACDAAYSWELWAAAERIEGGRCSDDGFAYFRLWLVSQGQKVYESALADPDSLADVPEVRRLAGRPVDDWDDEDWPEWEELDYVAQDVYDELTDQEDDSGDAFFDKVSTEQGDDAPDPTAPPRGRRLDAEAIPRLAALFPADAHAVAAPARSTMGDADA